jgi:rod shape determining protein RodA
VNLRQSIEKWVNPTLVAVLALLLFFGTTFLRTAVHEDSSFKKQLFGIGLGVALLVFFWIFDYRKFKDLVLPLFLFDAFLLLSPRIPGLAYPVNGSYSWLGLFGKVRLFQPSEPAKLVTILLLAAIIAQHEGEIGDLRGFLKVVGLSLIPFAAIMVQPDLGTGLVFIVIMLGLLLVGGARPRYLLALISLGIVLVALVFWVNGFTAYQTRDAQGRSYTEYKILKAYQIERLTAFVNPTAEARSVSYNLNQSKIAIGSGEVSGKGLGSGTQSKLNFLPERSTDFIFSVLGEETGFVGCAILLGLYLALLFTTLFIASVSADLYGTLISVGIISMWGFQILENVGMTMGLMPITGIPLPFMSYGSSFMITNLACAGVLLSVWRHRPYISSSKGVSRELSLG